MSTTPLNRHGIDRAALLRAVEPVVRAHGAELVDLEFKTEHGGWTLRVLVEKEGASAQALSTKDAAVSLELCANVSRDLSPALDVADLIPHAYRLEISSPGVERPLRGERDFIRFKGLKAKLRRRLPEGQRATDDAPGESRIIVGVLDGVADGHLHVIDGARTHQLPLAAIESARLVFEFGTVSPSSGKSFGNSPGNSSGGRARHGHRERRRPEHRKH
jgi:ribosome maturation factor RimP